MGKKCRQYTKEFKTEAVRLVLEEGRLISEMARDLGNAHNLLHQGKIYDTRQEAKTDIFDCIDVIYNRQRRHSYLGYLSPVDFEKKNAA